MTDNEERGSRPTGSHQKPIENSPEHRGSTPTRPQRNSETTGARVLALVPSSSTGRRLSATTAVGIEEVREMVATGKEPEAVDQTLRALFGQLVMLSTVSDWLTEDRTRIGEIIRYDAGDERVEGGWRLARAYADAAQQPMPFEELVRELTRVRAITKARAQADFDMEMTLTAYAGELCDYPADVLRVALRRASRLNSGFWPTVAEIEECIRTVGSERRMLCEAIQRVRP